LDTVCHKQLHFGSLFFKEIIADFEGGRITSDGGGLLLREVDQLYRLSERLASLLHDSRVPERITHELSTLLKQRLFAIALGYEDANDAAFLAQDPALKTMAERLPESGADLASQPTLSRFENSVRTAELYRFSETLLALYLATHLGPRKVLLIDLDGTDDPTHGRQQLSFFHGYYEEHMYHPLFVFDGEDGFPLADISSASLRITVCSNKLPLWPKKLQIISRLSE